MRIQYMSDLHLEFKDNLDYIKSTDFDVTGDELGEVCTIERGGSPRPIADYLTKIKGS